MDNAIGILVLVVLFAIYVGLPVLAIWFVARGGHTTRILVFIVSVAIVGISAFFFGSSWDALADRRQFHSDFATPFTELTEHLHSLAGGRQYTRMESELDAMRKWELAWSEPGSRTNSTLRSYWLRFHNENSGIQER